MAKVKKMPRPYKYLPTGGGFKVKLTNHDIEEINAATYPVKTIMALIPDPLVTRSISLLIGAQMYFIKKQNRKDGNRGVVLEFPFGLRIPKNWKDVLLYPNVRSIDTW